MQLVWFAAFGLHHCAANETSFDDWGQRLATLNQRGASRNGVGGNDAVEFVTTHHEPVVGIDGMRGPWQFEFAAARHKAQPVHLMERGQRC